MDVISAVFLTIVICGIVFTWIVHICCSRKSDRILRDTIEMCLQDQVTDGDRGDSSPIQNIPQSCKHQILLVQTLARQRSVNQGRTNTSFDNSSEKDDPPPAYHEFFLTHSVTKKLGFHHAKDKEHNMCSLFDHFYMWYIVLRLLCTLHYQLIILK